MSDLLKRLEIRAIGESIPRGVTSNDQACPWCGVDKSFAVTHTWKGDIAFMCHRASCGEAGYVKQRGVRGPSTQERVFTPRVFDLATQRVDPEGEASLLAAYGLTGKEIDWAGWVRTASRDRLCMPVLSPTASLRGWITKRLDGRKPKSDTFREVDDVWMGWYRRPVRYTTYTEDTYKTVVVVEDLISALVASRYYKACAILGTHLNLEMVAELVGNAEHVVLCFDRDATDKALGYAQRYQLYGNFKVVPLSKDIKNMNNSGLKEWNEQVRSAISN